MGAEPARGLNSRKARAATSEPSTKPMISGPDVLHRRGAVQAQRAGDVAR